MKFPGKISQLQIRVSEREKIAVRRAAERAGMDMSTYVLSRVLAAPSARFQALLRSLEDPAGPKYALAELNSFLADIAATELRDAVASAPERPLEPFLANYVAAMVESACAKGRLPVPAWVRGIRPLEQPMFGSQLESVRLHLLVNSPAAFRRRNIFVDTDVGSRV
jgi:uncharacterized protein (DUF1778 family)